MSINNSTTTAVWVNLFHSMFYKAYG